MARSRSAVKRQTRFWDQISGCTLATLESGVTISSQGIIVAAGTVSPTELSYLDGAAGDVVAYTSAAGYEITAGVAYWSGTSIRINVGLSTVAAFMGNLYYSASDTAPVSAPGSVIWQDGVTDQTVTAAIYVNGLNGAKAFHAAGGSIYWMAFGT